MAVQLTMSEKEEPPAIDELTMRLFGRKISDAAKRDMAPRPLTLETVPIGKIFEIEFRALGVKLHMQHTMPPRLAYKMELMVKYEEYAGAMMCYVAGLAGFNDISKADREELSEAVRALDEKELFARIAEFAQKKFRFSYSESSGVVIAAETCTFNCYSSTVLVADALTRLGKPVMAVIVPRHILLAADNIVFESTSILSGAEILTYSNCELHEMYPWRYEGGMSVLVADAYNRLGVAYLRAGSGRKAIGALNIALATEPHHQLVPSNLSIAFSMLGQREKALQYSEMALSENPENAFAWNCLGVALSKIERYEDAIRAFSYATSLMPSYANPMKNTGRAFYILGDPGKALEKYEMALLQNRNFVDVEAAKIPALIRLGRLNDAAVTFLRAAEASPRFILNEIKETLRYEMLRLKRHLRRETYKT
ncbi:MAG: hypothetical protein M1528_02195 [Candidatus Marsarchaeota archaeon]|nr:hypothetical protein [Candidatus Marsarchaeota archaeon]MCL5115320.1 hypothetical protein [Candidatus Marsarchaeota archaeon]